MGTSCIDNVQSAYIILSHRLLIVVLMTPYITVYWHSWTPYTTPSYYGFATPPIVYPFISHLLLPYSYIAIKASCVCQTLFQRATNFNVQQGGNESLSIHCPTKTVDRDCDIDLGRQIDVPAIAKLSKIAHCPTRRLGCLGIQVLFMRVEKSTCYRPSAFPLPCMTDSADCIHIEASFYHTSVCA